MVNMLNTEEENMLSESARGFLDDAAPVSHFRALRDAQQTHDAALWASMARMGWTGILVPEAAGGSDMGHAAAGVLATEMGKTLVNSPFVSTAVMAATALRQVSDNRAQEALSQIAQGSLTYAMAIDEIAKFAPEATATSAHPVGNGFRLSGTKRFVVDGGHADRLLVLARTGDGLTLFDLPSDLDGISRSCQPMIDSRDAAGIRFDDVHVTGDHILGALNRGLDILRPAIEAGQAAIAAEMAGLASGAFGLTVEYLNERKQFGVPIGSFQALQHRAAHLWCETELTASTILNAGRMLDEDPGRAALAVSLAKAHATATATLAVQDGVQMHGGIGMTDECDIGLFMKRARVAAEWLGDYGYHAGQVARIRGF
jgi:alkylation response protein AidB-like acyl-CoA dehydrogenase